MEESKEWWEKLTKSTIDDMLAIRNLNEILKKNYRILFESVKDIQDEEKYWNTICATLQKILCVKVPNPSNNFQKFIEIIFLNQFKLYPTSVEDIITFIKSSPRNENISFLIWNFSSHIKLSDFFNAFYSMIISNDEFYQKLMSYPQSLNIFFDHYFNLLDSSPIKNDKQMSLRINLINILCQLMIDHPDKIKLLYQHQRKMWDYLLKLMKDNYQSMSIESFRIATNFYLKSHQFFDSKFKYNWLIRMATNNASNSSLHFLSLKFILNLNFVDFKYLELCKALISNGINDVCDISFIEEILITKKLENVFSIFEYFFNLSTSKNIFANAARITLLNLLPIYYDNQELTSYIPLFIKRCFQFIIFSLKKNKYKCKRFIVLKFLFDLWKLNIESISSVVQRLSSSLIKAKIHENVICLMFKETNDFDEEFIKETMDANCDRVDIKNVLNNVSNVIPMLFIDGLDYSYDYSSYSSYSDEPD